MDLCTELVCEQMAPYEIVKFFKIVLKKYRLMALEF